MAEAQTLPADCNYAKIEQKYKRRLSSICKADIDLSKAGER